MSTIVKCPRCGRTLMGSARTCVVHGDQLDLGGSAPALETVKDQMRGGRRVPRTKAGWERWERVDPSPDRDHPGGRRHD
jgi:hypothetical protein